MLNIKKVMNELKIVSVKNYRFGSDKIQLGFEGGLALYHEKYGFISLNCKDKKTNIPIPYINTRVVLKELLNIRLNLNNSDQVQWIKPYSYNK